MASRSKTLIWVAGLMVAAGLMQLPLSLWHTRIACDRTANGNLCRVEPKPLGLFNEPFVAESARSTDQIARSRSGITRRVGHVVVRDTLGRAHHSVVTSYGESAECAADLNEFLSSGNGAKFERRVGEHSLGVALFFPLLLWAVAAAIFYRELRLAPQEAAEARLTPLAAGAVACAFGIIAGAFLAACLGAEFQGDSTWTTGAFTGAVVCAVLAVAAVLRGRRRGAAEA